MADAYVVVQLATTFEKPAVYVPRDACETIAVSWCTVDARTLATLARQSVMVKPLNTPVTPGCVLRYNLQWDDVKGGASFQDAVAQFDRVLTAQLAGKAFSFVTADVRGLRVLLPREARDKGVVLPAYLQHPRVFDLLNEYLKWQAVHPEALSYPASSLGNAITALGVDVGPQWNEDAQDDYTVAVAAHAAILVQLLKKSVPVEAHPTVLTKPYDTALDAKTFLAERSKILHLSNLPADTTHAELEAWFSQTGVRPVAFWALKSPETDPRPPGLQGGALKTKSVAGFAVFAKHEEAAEALYMNGRILMDRVVEVQASSTRVLDRASNLLAPFPPLKNRPRPGDWTCPSCGFSNFQRRIACFRCSFPATSAIAIQEQMFASPNGDGPANAGGTNARKLRPEERQAATGTGGYQDQYQGLAGGAKNYNNGYTHNLAHSHGAHNQRSHYGNQVPFRAGDWKCINMSCQYHNFAKNLCCLKCGASKPAMLMQNGASNNHSNGNHPAVANPGTGPLHSVNNTAAAIAAATASGQPLNLNNSFLGLQQPLPHQSRHSTSSQSSSSSSPIHSNGLYSNISHLQQLQLQQGKSQNNTSLSQHMGMMSMQGHSGSSGAHGRQRQSNSASSSPGLHVQQGYSYKGSRDLGDGGDGGAGSGNGIGVSSLSNQVSSMSLNHS